MKQNFVVYVLKNLSGRRYIGITSDLQKRLDQHNSGFSSYTRSKGPWNIIWRSDEMNHHEALKLEKKLKRQKGGTGLYKLLELNRGS